MADNRNPFLPMHLSPVPLIQDIVGDDILYEIVAHLVRNPNEVEESRHTLLHRACRSPNANPRIVKLLLERGADVNAATADGHTPLHFAVASRKRYAVDALIEAGASVNSRDNCGRTALHFSIKSCNPISPLNLPCDMWIVKRLLCHPEIDINQRHHMGCTPLYLAVTEENSPAVKELLRRGANPNIPQITGRTPLHWAMCPLSGNLSAVYALLKHGADIYCEDNSGETPIDVMVNNVHRNLTLQSAKSIVSLIVLHYRIEDRLKMKLNKIPELSEHFERCYKEVRLMHSQMIHGKFTLHDFVLNCNQTRFLDNNEDNFMPVASLLLSGSYVIYLHIIQDLL